MPYDPEDPVEPEPGRVAWMTSPSALPNAGECEHCGSRTKDDIVCQVHPSSRKCARCTFLKKGSCSWVDNPPKTLYASPPDYPITTPNSQAAKKWLLAREDEFLRPHGWDNVARQPNRGGPRPKPRLVYATTTDVRKVKAADAAAHQVASDAFDALSEAVDTIKQARLSAIAKIADHSNKSGAAALALCDDIARPLSSLPMLYAKTFTMSDLKRINEDDVETFAEEAMFGWLVEQYGSTVDLVESSLHDADDWLKHNRMTGIELRIAMSELIDAARELVRLANAWEAGANV